MRISVRRVGLTVATAGLTAVLAATAPAMAASAASVASTSPVTLDVVLLGTAVTSSSNAWAVGYFTPAGSTSRPMIQHWNGRTWKLMFSPTVGKADALQAVTAWPGGAWAVGDYSNGKAEQTLIQRWNGKAWKVIASPDPGGPGRQNWLYGVARVGTSRAWAVGYYGTSTGANALIERFNGTSWKQVPCPHPGSFSSLEAVTVVSATNAWAVGYYNSGSATFALIEHWNGKFWKLVPSPSSNQKNLFGIAAVSGTNAWAVGDSYTPTTQTLTEHWNGKSWKVVSSPDPAGPANFNELNAVAAASSNSVWAIGVYIPGSGSRTLIAHWNGKSWKQVKSLNPGTGNALYAVAATATRAWAVGYYHLGSSNLCLIEHWNGTAWTRYRCPNP